MEKELNEDFINRSYDEFLGNLVPFGSLDIRACVTTALTVNIDMRELAEIITNSCEETGTDLFNSKNTVDINAILNDHILQQARQELEEIIGVDILNDHDVYFFANYLDCPLQYSEECKKTISEKLKANKINLDDLGDCTQYVLDEMGIKKEDL